MKISRRTAANGEDELPETLHPVLRRVYLARGVTTAEGLGLGLEQLLPAAGLKGIEAAVALLESVLEAQGRILVVGDYDADGATSTALALLVLRAFGCEKVGYLVPNRFEFGYGLSPEIVELAARQQPDLIITVDNGIASISGVSRAAELGIPVLVTDHHLPGEQLPAAAAIVNPNQPGDGFASKNLAGVGVIFYLLVALRARLRQAGWFERCGLAVPNMAEWLDLVVLGTVADLVVLDQNNRILVEQGLRRIRAGRCRPGIEALIRLAGRDQSRLVASDLGYAIGPRLNAAGRLEDMGLGIECLLADDPSAALQMAVELDRLNRTRREIEQQMQEQAQQLLQQLHREMQGEIPLALCLYDPDWHQGVVGILASRIKEKYHRPVIAFADGGDGILKGSARSVPALHIRDLLERIASRHAGLIERFGGHAMAAGLSLTKQNLERFRQAFEAEAADWLDPAELVGELLSDGELEAEALGLELAQLLRQAGPWGQGFPAPLFDGWFQVLQQRVVGERHLKLRLRTEQGDAELDGIAFNQAEIGELASQVRLAYRLDVNEFRGRVQPQLVVEYIQSTT
ncbi:single-stranded-DNA-specific exonuclease RecJ [endosymbiont of Ridgeia piscesae]|uniref:Single-stranded-DNA-specific exonuclease RecJ n=1 Tax=endosymbiont of Ridgeia piscesae TaxID=54398 RepID=A0A0T5Z1G0_9GAMM|nr:single-stranded-DNA-specific exonuclease RecJ [endosymbiont of Ridgeia piscesae]KRT54598.1 exonuclease RecJ [endosymbiont of Ridgeia piscesae]KRT56740.1 exonuclease RecJ [endosymbiont of Ridgeia piscesae]